MFGIQHSCFIFYFTLIDYEIIQKLNMRNFILPFQNKNVE